MRALRKAQGWTLEQAAGQAGEVPLRGGQAAAQGAFEAADIAAHLAGEELDHAVVDRHAEGYLLAPDIAVRVQD